MCGAGELLCPGAFDVVREGLSGLGAGNSECGFCLLGTLFPGKCGDYASGTNHTLPTNGYARAYSGVNMDAFMKKITFQEIMPEGLAYLGKTIEIMADNEKLEAHGNAVRVRNVESKI